VNTEKGWRGGEQQMAYLVEGLRARGHGVRLALQPHGEAAPRLEAAGVDVVRTRMRGEADPFSMLRLRRIVRAYRPDIVHLHTSHAHALGGMAVRWAGAPRPAVIVSRRVDFSIYRRSFLGLNGWKYRHGLDRIVCVSEAIRQVLVNDGLDPATLAVVHSAVDPARVRDARPVDVRARLGLPAGCPLVLAVGALVGHKGHTHLVAALPALRAAVPGVRVVVAGEGPLRPDLEAQARALGVADALVLAGAGDRPAGWFHGVDLLVMPSTGGPQDSVRRHGGGSSRVASRAGGLPGLVDDGVHGRLVPPADPSALALAVAGLLLDPATRARLGAAGRARVDAEFVADRMVEGTLAVYADVLRGREARSPA
jgi:glycosyltransferase involved in cell wall biosynthesis